MSMTTHPSPSHRQLYSRRRRRRGRAVITFSLAVGLLVCSLIFLVWSRFQVTSVGYQISRARDEQKRLLNINKELRIEGASLKSPARIEGIARGRLGLSNPEPQQMVHLQ
jgi:cell division protein FtsL